MKKKLYTLISILISFVFAFSASAYELRAPRDEGKGITKGKEDVFFEDFTSYEEGANPASMTIKEYADSPVEVTEIDTPDKKNKNVLKMVDALTTGANSVSFDVPESTSPLMLEMRFKFKRTTTDGYGFIIDFQGDGTNAFRIIKYSSAKDNFNFINNSGSKSLSGGVDYHDQWFTLKVRWDPSLKQCGIVMESDLFKTELDAVKQIANQWQDTDKGIIMSYSLPWYNEYDKGPITKIVMSPYGSSCGEYYIDYIKVVKNTEEFLPERKRVESKEAVKIADPVQRIVPGKTNIIFKGEVKYFANPVISINYRTMIDVKNYASWYGMVISENDGEYIISNTEDEIRFKPGDGAFFVNDKAFNSDVAPQISNDCLYIPLRSFAEAMGSVVSWSSEKSCVTID